MLKVTWENGAWSVELITLDDVASLPHIFSLIAGRKEGGYLDYRTTTAETSYANSRINWLKIESRQGPVHAPYEILVDYRNRPNDFPWGKFKFSGDFEFPNILAEHREAMIVRFNKENRLYKGNNPAPRVKKFEMINGKPTFTLEKASYFDQVGTNLTLDHRLHKSIDINDVNCKTVREWDIAQAGLNKSLPSFEKSKLANTIGIAIGITAKSQNGEGIILRRKREKNMADYAGMWHVPFSFALSMSQFKEDNGELGSLIKSDWGHEFDDELGLEFADFEEPRLIAFCRDLARGGKPQFFFEMRSKLLFEELCEKISKKTPEFNGKIQGFRETKEAYSTELVAFTFLKSGGK